MIISNPPYISDNEIGVMSEDTLLHEPDEALFAENNGLFFYCEICRNGMDYLPPSIFFFNSARASMSPRVVFSSLEEDLAAASFTFFFSSSLKRPV